MLIVQRIIITAMFFFISTNSSALSLDEVLAPSIISHETSETSAWFNTTINRKQIDESGVQTIPELLALIPGFIHRSPYGSYQAPTYRGMSDEYPRRTLVEIDGVSVNVASTGSVFWEAFPFGVEDVERVTFIANPSSSLNGDQAFNGVLKIYTVKADEQNNKIVTSFGNKNLKEFYFRKSGFVANNIALQVSGSRKTSSGEFNKLSTENNTKLWLNGLYKSNAKNTLSVNLGFGNSYGDESSDSSLPYIPNYQDRKISNGQGSLSWINTDNGVLTLTAGVNFIDYNVDNISYVGLDQNLSYDSLKRFVHLNYQKEIAQNLGIYTKFSVRSDIETPNDWSQTESEWDTTVRSFRFGGTYSFDNKTHLDAGAAVDDHSIYGAMRSSHVSLLKELTFNSYVSLLYSNGFRFPTNWEGRSQHFLTDPLTGVRITRNFATPEVLRPEKVESLSFKYNFKINSSHSFSVRLFHDSYKDLIYYHLAPAPAGYLGLFEGDVVASSSGASVKLNGAELYAKSNLTKNLKSIISYSHMSPLKAVSLSETDYSKALPDDILTVGLIYQLGSFKVSGYASHFSQVIWDGRSDKYSNNGYTTASIHLSKCNSNEVSLESVCFTLSAQNFLEPDSSFFAEEEGAIIDTQWVLKVDYRF